MNKRGIIKGIVSFVGSACVGGLTTLILKNSAIPSSKKEEIMVKVGSYIIGAMASSKSSDFIEQEMDNIYEAIDNILGQKAVDVEPVKLEEN